MTARKIVVGVDGSSGAQRALDWALDEARLHGAALDVLHVYEPPVENLAIMPGGVAGGSTGYLHTLGVSDEERAEYRERAKRWAEDVVDKMLERTSAAGVTVLRKAIADRRPARALLAASEDADLLVVGSRGLGGFRGLLMGSVSQQVASHARRPVVVVPGNGRAEES